VIEDVPVVVYRPECRVERTLSSVQAFCCAECRTPTAQIQRGRELELVALEIES
jgi:hydrogenase nickel incorporation protein HypA/HybF